MDFFKILLTYMAMLFSLNVSSTTIPDLENYLVTDAAVSSGVEVTASVFPDVTEVPDVLAATESPSPVVTQTPVPSTEPTADPVLTESPAPTSVPTAIPTATPTQIPKPTATPTAKPTATPTPTPTPTPAPTPSPTPSPTPTATPVPKPTITPNMSYKTLKRKDKGENVLAMQTRLQELGYYTGELDGRFGQGTYNALLRFQKRNKLSGDGIAGQRTLTILYESPDVVWAEGAVTPTPSSVFIPVPTK